MRIESISGNSTVSMSDTSREEAAIRKQILTLKKELQEVSNEEGDEKEIARQKKEIEQQIARLQQQLQQLKTENSQGNSSGLNSASGETLKEPGKGLYVDEYR